jgi:hypothetical protein
MGKRQRVMIQQLTTLAPRVTIRSLASDIKKGMDTSKTEQSGSQGVNIDQQGSGPNGVHPFFDIRCKAVECLLNVDVVLGRNLEEGNAEFQH